MLPNSPIWFQLQECEPIRSFAVSPHKQKTRNLFFFVFLFDFGFPIRAPFCVTQIPSSCRQKAMRAGTGGAASWSPGDVRQWRSDGAGAPSPAQAGILGATPTRRAGGQPPLPPAHSARSPRGASSLLPAATPPPPASRGSTAGEALEREWTVWTYSSEDFALETAERRDLSSWADFWAFRDDVSDGRVDLSDGTTLCVFERGVKPTWEDSEAHGKWVVLTDKRETVSRLLLLLQVSGCHHLWMHLCVCPCCSHTCTHARPYRACCRAAGPLARREAPAAARVRRGAVSAAAARLPGGLEHQGRPLVLHQEHAGIHHQYGAARGHAQGQLPHHPRRGLQPACKGGAVRPVLGLRVFVPRGVLDSGGGGA